MLEYIAMLAVYFAVFLISNGNVIVALIAMVASLFVLRATRPKHDEPPPPPGSGRL